MSGGLPRLKLTAKCAGLPSLKSSTKGGMVPRFKDRLLPRLNPTTRGDSFLN